MYYLKNKRGFVQGEGLPRLLKVERATLSAEHDHTPGQVHEC
jgi:hypothetical protein